MLSLQPYLTPLRVLQVRRVMRHAACAVPTPTLRNEATVPPDV